MASVVNSIQPRSAFQVASHKVVIRCALCGKPWATAYVDGEHFTMEPSTYLRLIDEGITQGIGEDFHWHCTKQRCVAAPVTIAYDQLERLVLAAVKQGQRSLKLGAFRTSS